MKRFGALAAAVAVAAFINPVLAQQQRASPAKKANATVGGANIEITYSAPSKKGRQIWGGPLLNSPNAQVWRLGANEATTLKTSAPLTFGSVKVPAGSYTLYFDHAKEGAEKLIISKQTGQWGTEYSEAQDLGRVDLKMEKLSTPAEQLAITIESQGDGGAIRIAWDDRAYSAPFTGAKS
jgi:hypothetical protein